MTAKIETENGHALELVLELDAPKDNIWRCWIEEELFRQWFCPSPWKVTSAEIDLRAGGRFNSKMEGPNGESFDNKGMFLHVEPGESLVTTDAFTEGFIPTDTSFMTGYMKLEDLGNNRTRLTWGARHPTEEKAKEHLEMGWEQGWNTVAQQLETLAKTL